MGEMNSLTRLLWLVVWLGLLAYLALTLWLGVVGLTYPYQLDYGEGIVLWFAQQIARGQPIYKGLADLPYASSNYPPVALILSAVLMPLFGDGYLGGRLLNFASALIVAALIFRIVHTETRNRRAGALSALFFLGSPYIFHWIPLFRVDLIGLAFAFGGVYLVWRFDRRPMIDDRRIPAFYFCLFTFAFLLALYTKHSLFAAPLAAFLALWLRDRRRAVVFASALGALGGAIYLALDRVTRGGFTFGIVESNATVFLPEQLGALAQNFVGTFPILLLLALWGWVARIRAKRIGVLEWYAVTAFAALAMSGRVGAWENYFFEALAIACVFLGFQISAVGGQPSAVSRQRSAVRFAIRNSQFLIRNSQFAIPTLLLLQLVLLWHDPRVAADLIARDFPANQELARVLARTSGTIISEDMGALATSGKPIEYYTFQYSSLARSGKWDQHWELNGLRAGAFPLVILERGTREDVEHYRRFTREFVSALDRHYAPTQTIGKYVLYAPAPLAHLQSAEFGDALALIGWSAQPSNFQSFGTAQDRLPTSNFQITIVWQARRALPRRYTAFVHLETGDGGKVTQDDREPLGGIYPTTRWAANEMVRDVYALNLPRELAPGKYVLRVGWYDTETGDRLPVAGSADDAVVLMTFEK
ncbi:MAG: glycosyltransferase family 39 protein [Chloroflexi bacterium]|nr:glycosyltransferase family 39 protein [Chloroflexota bacterium]